MLVEMVRYGRKLHGAHCHVLMQLVLEKVADMAIDLEQVAICDLQHHCYLGTAGNSDLRG